MIGSLLRKRTAKKPYGNIASQESIDAFVAGGAPEQTLREGEVEFLLALVRGNTPTVLTARAGQVADIAAQHGAVVHDLVCSLVVAGFGTLPVRQDPPGARLALVEELRRALGDDVKILHGKGRGFFGIIANDSHPSHTFILAEFETLLAVLSQMNFGQADEFAP